MLSFMENLVPDFWEEIEDGNLRTLLVYLGWHFLYALCKVVEISLFPPYVSEKVCQGITVANLRHDSSTETDN